MGSFPKYQAVSAGGGGKKTSGAASATAHRSGYNAKAMEKIRNELQQQQQQQQQLLHHQRQQQQPAHGDNGMDEVRKRLH